MEKLVTYVKKNKPIIIIGAIFVIIAFAFIGLILLIVLGSSKTTINNEQIVKPTVPRRAPADTRIPIADTATPVPTVVLAEDKKLEKFIREIEELKGDNNNDLPNLEDLHTLDQGDNTFNVVITMNASDNISTSYIKHSIEFDYADIFYAIYNSDFKIAKVTIGSFFPMTDKYGNTDDIIVYQAYLEGDIAAKINWEDNSESDITMLLLPELWTVQKDRLE